MITIHPAVVSEAGKFDVADIMSWAASIKKCVQAADTKVVEVYTPQEMSITQVRKALECYMYNSNLKILCRLSKTQKREFQQRSQKRGDEESILIHAKEGASYSDVVKELKSSISPTEIGLDIKRFKSTRNGHVRIQCKEIAPGAKAELINKIRSSITSAENVQLSQKTKGIVLLDIEYGVDDRELVTTLSKTLAIDET